MAENLEFACARDGCRGCGKCSVPPEVARLKRDVEYYRDQLHEANERIRMMTSAATSAAASTVTAIERIQEMEKVVNAAVNGEPTALKKAVAAWLAYKGSWS
jgi:hypothetical protein